MYQTKVKLTTPNRLTFTIKDFSGGICNTVSPLKMNDNMCVDMLNIQFGENGVLQKRNGLYNSIDYKINLDNSFELDNYVSPKDGSPAICFFILEPNLNEYGYLIGTEHNLVYISTKGKVKAMEWQITSNHVPIRGVQYLDKFYFVDGGRRVHYYKMSDLEDDSIEQPIRYYISNPPEGFTPNPKPAVTGVTKESETYKWNEKNPSSTCSYPCRDIWYEPCQSEMEDGFKGSNNCVLYPRHIAVYKDRLIISGNTKDPNMVYISDVNNPLYFPSALPVQTPPVGDYITCLIPFRDSIVIGRRDSIYMLTGSTNRDDTSVSQFSLQRVNTHTGIPNYCCSNQINNYLFYVGSDGHAYKMTITDSITEQPLTVLANKNCNFMIEPFNLPLEDIKNARTGYDPSKQEWYVHIKDITFVYNYSLMAWTRYDNIKPVVFITLDNKFYIAQEDGLLYQFDKDVNSDCDFVNEINGIPIYAYWKSKEIDLGLSTKVKQIRNTYLVSESFDKHRSDIVVKYTLDNIELEKKHSVDSEVPLWDVASWDNFKFYGRNLIRSLPIMVGRRCRSFNVMISSPYRYIGCYSTMPNDEEILNMREGDVFVIKKYNDEGNPHAGFTFKYYRRTAYDFAVGKFFEQIDFFPTQPMKLYELSGIYEVRGYM